MASSSSFSSSRTWRYRVFASFHGADVRKTFLSHLRKQFSCSGITMFDDQGIERSQIIAPALTQAIRESRISIIVLSKNYASSSWCLDELLEIFKCKEELRQIVMTVFYGVDPSHVRNQTGDFGKVFNETCARKTEEERQRWSQALNDVGNIAGEHFLNWDNEVNMIEKIAKDVSDKLNATPSRDFDGIVGLEAHLRKLKSLLDLDNDGVKMVGIYGHAGIGKSTIARALHSRLSGRFQLTCFVDDLRGSYPVGLDEYGLKLRLQDQLLSKVLKQNNIRVCHLGSIEERLRDQKVLIILDDVNNIKQLEALANETSWFGPRSRILVTTENRELLQQHGINNTYHVGFPSDVEAIEILRKYAFLKSCPHSGFKELAKRVTKLCGNLPLGLRVVGSSLRGKNEDEWKEVICRLETILDRDIEEILKVSYKSLHDNEKSLFLHIAVFFNCKDGDLVKAMLADNYLDIEQGLKILVNRSLIYISTQGEIVMHKLLQQVGKKAVQREEPWKRRILTNGPEICDVLERAEGTRAVSGILFDISDMDEVSISERAFKRMPNLRFLKVYKRKDDGSDLLHTPDEMELPRRLRLLHWEAYPSKCLPPKFPLEHLVELYLPNNKFEKLWGGTQPFTNLKKMDLSLSSNLKELPDLSKAANLERLVLRGCSCLIEIPSSIGNLHKLESLDMSYCVNLQVVPSLFSLVSLDFVDVLGCWKLRNIPGISTKIASLTIADKMLNDLLESNRLWSRLRKLSIHGDGARIKKLPDCIKDLHGLEWLDVQGCSKLASLPKLPRSLKTLTVNNCESMKTLTYIPSDSQFDHISFPNCFELDQEARRVILKSWIACLPGKEMPARFNHRAMGHTLTIRSDLMAYRTCVVVSPKQEMDECHHSIRCRILINGCSTDRDIVRGLHKIQAEHLCLSHLELIEEDGWLQLDNYILFEFSTTSQDLEIIECGVQIVGGGSWLL